MEGTKIPPRISVKTTQGPERMTLYRGYQQISVWLYRVP